ncbi:MAG: M81 family metallopeptidase [Deltaproteobacteria bacterium]|nr:M81 family metallopeptidase [Deltaproteobacteria bacterium]
MTLTNTQPAEKPRIVFFRVAQETNALSPVRTELEDFKRTIFMEGQQLMDACLPGGNEAPGFTKNAELSGFVKSWSDDGEQFDLVPLFSAWAIPGGPLSVECFGYFRERLLRDLKETLDEGPIAGLFFSLHGAMCADGTDDPEGDLLEDLRKLVGPKIPIAVSCDLHAQITKKKFENADILRAYHTNPHRDHYDTGRKTGEALFKILHGKAKATASWRTLPLVLGGGTTLDFLPPMRSIFKRIKKWEKDPRVLSVSITNVQIWHDDYKLGWASFVMTDNNPQLAESIADELAEMCWGVRHKQLPHFPSAEEAIAKIHKMRIRPLFGVSCICDASDVVGAGAPGENPRLIEAILEHGRGLLSYAPIRDSELVAKLWETPIDTWVDVDVGGKLHPEQNHPLRVHGKLITKKYTENFDRVLVLKVECLRLVITEGIPMVMKPSFYKDVGLNIWKADIVVVKSFFPFRLFFAPYSRRTFYVRTEGVTDFDAGMKRAFDAPVHPKDVVLGWRETDAMRRGLTSSVAEVSSQDDTANAA